jgi:hypothetical protein
MEDASRVRGNHPTRREIHDMNIASGAGAALAALFLCAGAARADNGIGGDETTADRVVNSSNVWTVLVAEPFQLVNDISSCIATGSADAQNPNNGNDRLYRFALSIDNANPVIDGPCERTVDFDVNANKMEEVSSTCTFRELAAGNHTIYWLARKTPNTPNMLVIDNSMTFTCHNSLMDPFDGLGDGQGD